MSSWTHEAEKKMLETRRLTDWIFHREELAARVPAGAGENWQPDAIHRSGGVTRRSRRDGLQSEGRVRKTRQPPHLDLWLP